MLLSIVWFLWHIPFIDSLGLQQVRPTISSLPDDFREYLPVWELKEYSKGAVPCILAHMLIDSLAVLMLVQSSLPQIILLVIFEILVASWLVAARKSEK